MIDKANGGRPGVAHDNNEDGPEGQPSTEFTLLRPLFVLTSQPVAPAGRHRTSAEPHPGGWAGLLDPAGTGPTGSGRATSAAAAGVGAGGHATDRVRRRTAAVVAVAAVAATVVAVGLMISGPDLDPSARSAVEDGRDDIVVDGLSSTAYAPPSVASQRPTADSGPAATPASSRPRTMSPSPTTTTAKAPRFVAVAGESCPEDADRGFRVSGRSSDWYSRSSGGWDADGCRGRVVSVPMSGSPTRDDRDNVIVWWFHTGAVRTGSCALGVHVPDTGHPKDAAGKPAHYLVRAADDLDGPVIAEFDVDQSANQGRWVDAGRYGVTSGEISVQMVTRGIDFGSGRDDDHLGVSALRADCRAG
jgi:hypothetical protein